RSAESDLSSFRSQPANEQFQWRPSSPDLLVRSRTGDITADEAKLAPSGAGRNSQSSERRRVHLRETTGRTRSSAGHGSCHASLALVGLAVHHCHVFPWNTLPPVLGGSFRLDHVAAASPHWRGMTRRRRAHPDPHGSCFVGEMG